MGQILVMTVSAKQEITHIDTLLSTIQIFKSVPSINFVSLRPLCRPRLEFVGLDETTLKMLRTAALNADNNASSSDDDMSNLYY